MEKLLPLALEALQIIIKRPVIRRVFFAVLGVFWGMVKNKFVAHDRTIGESFPPVAPFSFKALGEATSAKIAQVGLKLEQVAAKATVVAQDTAAKISHEAKRVIYEETKAYKKQVELRKETQEALLELEGMPKYNVMSHKREIDRYKRKKDRDRAEFRQALKKMDKDAIERIKARGLVDPEWLEGF